MSTTSAAFVKASCIPTCWINYLCEKLKSWFNNQFLKKKKKTEQKERDLNIIENFKIESRYLKLCYQSRAFIRCVKAAFYWPDYQNSQCVRWSKDSTEDSFWKMRWSLWNTQPSFWRFKRKLKARLRIWSTGSRVSVVTRAMLSHSATVNFRLATIADWDSIDLVVTQTRGQAF